MTLYLLDANVIIRAHEDYYPVDRIPQFWSWLLDMAVTNVIKMPRVIFDEVKPSTGPLADWLKQAHVRETMILAEPVDVNHVQLVLAHGYAPDLNDVEIEEIGKDPFLIAAALAGPDRAIVTREVSKPSKRRAERRIPDVCSVFRIPVITDFGLYRTLNFSIQ
jgi:Domain of unknown function (DUF4411)